MERWQIIGAGIMLVISILTGIASYQGFKNKGPVLTNTYLWATKEQRKKIDKKIEYYLQMVIFGGIMLLFLLNAIGILTTIYFFNKVAIAIAVLLCVYAIYDSVRYAKKRMNYYK